LLYFCVKLSIIPFKMRFSFFKDKVVLVTGSSKGIGRATAARLLAAGAMVVINGRNEEQLKQTAHDLGAGGHQVLAIAGDVSDASFCQAMMAQVVHHFGRLDILINNAGGGFRGRLEDTSPLVIRQVIDANLMSALYCTQAALPLIKASGGSIILVSSLSAIRGLPNNGPYCVAKMGLTALADTLRVELHGTGVHVGLLLVGITDYDDQKRVLDAQGNLIPIARNSHHTRDQVAALILKSVVCRQKLVTFTLLGKIQAFFHRFFPGLLEWVLIRTANADLYR
jgi:NAD(P)-dependent dehydrogenase (short-subunit alcohol dehydrogenase family)